MRPTTDCPACDGSGEGPAYRLDGIIAGYHDCPLCDGRGQVLELTGATAVQLHTEADRCDAVDDLAPRLGLAVWLGALAQERAHEAREYAAEWVEDLEDAATEAARRMAA